MLCVLFLLLASSLIADIVTLRDGKVIRGVIKSESEDVVTVAIYGEEVTVPRSKIASISKESAEINEELISGEKALEKKYEAESVEYTPPPDPAPTPADSVLIPPSDIPESDDGGEQEVISFPAEPPPPEPDGPTAGLSPPANAMSERLSHEEEVRRAVREKRVIPGMTEEQVRSSWGWPDLTHPVHGTYVYTDRWIYDRDTGPVSLFFNNGMLVSISQ